MHFGIVKTIPLIRFKTTYNIFRYVSAWEVAMHYIYQCCTIYI